MAFTHPAQAEEHFNSKNHKKKMSKLDKQELGFDLLPEDEPYVTRYCKAKKKKYVFTVTRPTLFFNRRP
jgi:hypothetical protein